MTSISSVPLVLREPLLSRVEMTLPPQERNNTYFSQFPAEFHGVTPGKAIVHVEKSTLPLAPAYVSVLPRGSSCIREPGLDDR